ncbi:hypothetical protein CRUP_022319 [Coryphaenoides rupestris]|nr:hypothetical protein CRUP_022319 [Coryphaenoides rupestris]
MSTQLCKLVVLTVRRPGCRVPWRMDSGQVVLTTMGLSQSRAYSLDSLSPGPGRSSLGHSNQQPRVEGISASSALTHRNLSAVAVQRVAKHLGPDLDDPKTIIFECNPDIPVKVVGVLPLRNERSKLLKLEPCHSFVSSKPGYSVCKGKPPNDHMCLVSLRPRADLFSWLTPSNASTLLFLVKQCLAKRKVKLRDRLNQWSPDSGSNLLDEMRLPQDILTGNVFPEEYLRLFQLMEQSQEFMQSWLYDEILENTLREGWV